jgi:hypothetical protein
VSTSGLEMGEGILFRGRHVGAVKEKGLGESAQGDAGGSVTNVVSDWLADVSCGAVRYQGRR